MGAFLFAAAGLVLATLLCLLRPWRPAAPASSRAARRTPLVLSLLLPLAATGTYALLGTPDALLLRPPSPAATHAIDTSDIERMVAGLAARLERNPDDPPGWAMLARSYLAMGRPAQARAAFERIGEALQRDPALLAQYADVMAAQADGQIDGEPLKLVQAALRLDPDNPLALSLAATAAYRRQDFAEATRHWTRLLKQLPPESAEAQWLAAKLAAIAPPR